MEIQVDNLKKSFGKKTALNIERLEIGSSEIVGIVGNNGAGKTTLFRLMLDLLKADGGTVSYHFNNGQTIHPTKTEDWKLYTGAYIEESFLIDFLTPEEYFDFLSKICDIPGNEFEERLKTIEQFTSSEIFGKNKLIRDYSAGNKQKVGIMSALIKKPELVILDEPFNFLDPTSQNLLKKLLCDYNALTGATILISSHNLQNTIDISTRIVLLEHGKVVLNKPNNEEIDNELIEYFQI